MSTLCSSAVSLASSHGIYASFLPSNLCDMIQFQCAVVSERFLNMRLIHQNVSFQKLEGDSDGRSLPQPLTVSDEYPGNHCESSSDRSYNAASHGETKVVVHHLCREVDQNNKRGTNSRGETHISEKRETRSKDVPQKRLSCLSGRL